MTWFSENSTVPSFLLASLTIQYHFVSRFAGSMVPFRVSWYWFSPRGASLPSFGSHRAWFPALTGSMKALRLPTCASTVTYFVRFRRPRDPPVFVSASPDLAQRSWRNGGSSRPGHWDAG